MTDRSDTFNKVLTNMVKPRLEAEGFVFDRSRTFRKIDIDKEKVAIINFQLGQRSLEGKFTVNLGVYIKNDTNDVALQKAYPHHCKQGSETRIGLLLPPKIRVFDKTPVLGFFFGSNDKWWKFSGNSSFTEKQLELVTSIILNYGVPWLYSKSP